MNPTTTPAAEAQRIARATRDAATGAWRATNILDARTPRAALHLSVMLAANDAPVVRI
ncbi:MAG: hypothetical protein Q8S73_12645 [Deltaproteobacteria bacterium]|nr:hypothetical protein [Myxococcales bacterium]MDP3214948.1 hypothetical protein [Deltaproteobacteria bacterium]